MAWIEVHQSLPTHRKTLAVADALDLNPAHVVGHLTCLWLWALDNAQDGVLTVGPRTISRAAQWEGNPQAFFDALVAAGFLDAGGHIHDWDAYAGRLLDQRAANAEKQRRWREAHKRVTSLPISSSRDGDVTATSPSRTAATVPNRTVPNQPNQPATPNGVALAPDADAPDAPATPSRVSRNGSHELTIYEPTGPAQSPTPAANGRPRDLVWDELERIFGPPRTKVEHGRRNEACKQLRDAAATAAEIARAHDSWPNVMRDATETPLGLAANLGVLLNGPQVNGRSAGTVRRHEQKVTESALVLAEPSMAELRAQRDARRQRQEEGRYAGN